MWLVKDIDSNPYLLYSTLISGWMLLHIYPKINNSTNSLNRLNMLDMLDVCLPVSKIQSAYRGPCWQWQRDCVSGLCFIWRDTSAPAHWRMRRSETYDAMMSTVWHLMAFRGDDACAVRITPTSDVHQRGVVGATILWDKDAYALEIALA